MEEIGDGMVAVEAEAGVLQGVVTMGSIHMLVVVLAEGILTGPMATTIVGGLEAAVLGIEEKEVEAQLAGIGVRSEKVVQKGEQR